MNTGKFLHTDMKQYLDKDGMVTLDNFRIKEQLISYKYNPGVRSSYGATFKNMKGHQKQTVWNLDNERRKLKVPYKPPGTFITTCGAAHVDTQGTGLIGAMSSDGKGYVRRGAPKGETEDDLQKAFISQSGYQLQYTTYGNLPKPNRRPQKAFAAGYGKINQKSSYQLDHSGVPDDKYRETAKLEKQSVKAYQQRQVRGQLNPNVPLPFKGQSTNQKEFVSRKNEGVEKFLPFSLVSNLNLLLQSSNINAAKKRTFHIHIYTCIYAFLTFEI